MPPFGEDRQQLVATDWFLRLLKDCADVFNFRQGRVGSRSRVFELGFLREPLSHTGALSMHIVYVSLHPPPPPAPQTRLFMDKKGPQTQQQPSEGKKTPKKIAAQESGETPALPVVVSIALSTTR